MTDNHYTPRTLALDLVKLSKLRNPRMIVDFAVGPGSLLHAAKQAWPKAELHGLDLDLAALGEAQSNLSGIVTYHADYLTDRAMTLTADLYRKIDVVLLNPPFTCRGSSFEETSFGNRMVKSSKAMAFILRSCGFLRPNGEVLAIVPRSCLFSEKDAEARRSINLTYVLEDMGRYESPGFHGASVAVHLVRVTRRASLQRLKKNNIAAVTRIKPKQPYKLAFMRGSHAVGEASTLTKGFSLIHTTNLFGSEISISRRRAVKTTKRISGTVVMMPRVARPSLEKIGVGSFVKPVVPSDCIICIKTIPAGHETQLLEKLQHYWELLKDAYSGTCASYLTLSAFQEFAEKIGFEAELTDNPAIWNPSEHKAVVPSRVRSKNES